MDVFFASQMFPGAGTFGTVRAGIYRPKNGGPELECAVKALKPMDELPNQKVMPSRERMRNKLVFLAAISSTKWKGNVLNNTNTKD